MKPIDAEWLSTHGWKYQSQRNDGNTHLPGFMLRPIAWESVEGRQPFQSPDDLCIAVAPSPPGDSWHVWIYQLEPYRHIHVRHMRHVEELIRLYEGLTGREWPKSRTDLSKIIGQWPGDETDEQIDAALRELS